MKNQFLAILVFLLSINLNAQENKKYIHTSENGSTQSSVQNVVNEFYLVNKSLVWSVANKVSTHANEDSRDMGISIGPDSTIHIVYSDDVPGLPSISRQRITYTSKTINGNWTTPIIIDEYSGVAARNNHEASINVSNNGDIHTVFHYWAYDGTGRNQIGYSKYTKQTSTWSTELISSDSGTVYATYSDYPRVTSTTNNIPVAVWGNDNRNGYDEVYLTYNNGTWQTPIQISSTDSNKAQFPVVVPLDNDKVFILFREYNITQDTLALYYRTFDANNGTLSAIGKISQSERPSTTNYDSYYLFDACNDNNGKVFILFNSSDTLHSFYYDITNYTVTKNPQVVKSNYTGYTNYNLPSISADNTGNIHIAYTVWNTSNNAVRYINYNQANGFSSSEIISTEDCLDAPQLVVGVDNKLHVAFADDSEDTNNDGYVDREVYYLFADNTVNIKSKFVKPISIYPNPSNGIYKIDLDEPSEIIITNVNGMIVYQGLSEGNIDISSQANGIYFINIKNNKDCFFSRLIKQ